ncbi:MAG TPA: MFS transporter [Steroidobacteraceae bacterium]|nr:MFS transporter [Steroidobacteraceae bacterium]
MASVADEVNVDRVLDAARFAGLPIIVMCCATLVLVLDGFDLQIIGFVAPLLATDFHVERSQLAPVLAASLFGMAIGSFAVGTFGDRWGRRPALLGSVALFGLTTLLGASSANLWVLAAWRFLTGIGLGGALPNATALMAEFAPPRWRNQAIALAIVGVPLGGMLGSALAAEILGAYGWRVLFVIGGALPLLAAAGMHFVLPESPRFLATKGRSKELAALLNRITGANAYRMEQRYTTDHTAAAAAGVRTLFSQELWRDTLATWLIFASNSVAIYAFFSWSPVVLTSLGFDIATAVKGSFYFNLAGIIGAVANAWLIARVGSRAPVAMMAAVAATALFLLGQLTPIAALDASSTPSVHVLMTGIAFAGLGINAVQIGMYAVSAHVYPTVCRASGVGWALGAGRVGGILSAFYGGALLAQSGGRGFFIGVGCALVVAFAGILLIRRHIPPTERLKSSMSIAP